MGDKKKPSPAPPIDIERWPDGINPYVDDERRQLIIKTRRERAAEVEQWKREHPDAD